MQKIVGVKSADNRVISEEELKQLERAARASVAKIQEKPKIEELYKAVDDIWAKGQNRQLIFQNKDQHLEYVTTYYKEYIEPISLDQYRNMVLQQLLSQIDKLRSAVDTEKQAEAVKLHKEHEAKVLKNMEDQLEDLKDRNNAVNKAIEDEIHHD